MCIPQGSSEKAYSRLEASEVGQELKYSLLLRTESSQEHIQAVDSGSGLLVQILGDRRFSTGGGGKEAS